MSSDTDVTPRPDPGLPTVTPPSGGMFLRLFGVPALIVGGLVMVLIVVQPFLGKFFRSNVSPEQVLRDLDNSNKEVRGRAANDLVQVLLRDDELASDSTFALQLTQRLCRTRDRSASFEKVHAEHFAQLSKADEEGELAKLETDRDYILLLTQCLSRFIVPVGVPALEEMAVQESGLDPLALNARRRQALWALANLGENVKRFDGISSERQEAIKARLETEAQSSEQAAAAKAALEHLIHRQQGRPDAFGMDRVVESCAEADDPSVRELAAYVVNFWIGTAQENARMEKALIRLSNDTGKGEDELRKLEAEKPPETGSLLRLTEKEETQSLIKKPGFRVQANAAIALARKGWKVRLSLLQTLLDEDELRSIFVVRSKKGGAERPDQAAVVETMLNALKAVAELHRKDPERDLSSLRPNIDNLAHNPNPAVQTEAGRVILALSNP
jgi:hypothetical protein